MSNTEKTSIDVNKFLEVQSKELDVRNAEINSKNIDSQNQKEIRLKEIDKSVEVEQIEKEKMEIFFDADEKQEKRKFVISLLLIGIGFCVLVISSFMLYIDHKYGATIFFSCLSFVAGIFSGIGLKKVYERESIPRNWLSLIFTATQVNPSSGLSFCNKNYLLVEIPETNNLAQDRCNKRLQCFALYQAIQKLQGIFPPLAAVDL